MIIAVKAVAVENVDKLIAAGEHYASKKFIAQLPAIPAFDGIGTLPDGTLVGFGDPRPPYGALAEKTVVASNSFAPIAEGIDGSDQRLHVSQFSPGMGRHRLRIHGQPRSAHRGRIAIMLSVSQHELA